MTKNLYCQYCGFLLCKCTCSSSYKRGFAQGKLAERERLNAIVVFDKEHKIDWYASYKLLKSQLNEGEKHGEKV